MTIRPNVVRVALLAALAAVTSTAVAGEAPVPDTVIRAHTIQVAGHPLHYESEAGRLAIADAETGVPHGYMYYTAYRIPTTKRTRPVTFVWNGGPGADSSLLHFSAGGPRRADAGRLLVNEETWLTDTDLVFVDPIGTGFSRPAKAEYADEFYSTRGDVASVTEFVRAWRLLHDAEAAPTFLVGESWGARRAASVAYALQARHVTVSGIVLISGGWGLNHEYVDAPLRAALPSVDMATIALYYGKSSPAAGKTVDEVRATVGRWAREVYAPALTRTDTLTESDRVSIVSQLAAYIGLPIDAINPRTFTVSPRDFRRNLLRDRAQEPYVFDMRRTSPPSSENTTAILHELRHDLGYRTSLPYVGLEEASDGFAPGGASPQPVGERWDYATEKLSPEEVQSAIAGAIARGDGPPKLGAPLPATEEALAQNPRLRVLVAAGLYDSFFPCAVGEDTRRHLPTPLAAAIEFRCYVGGHAMYLDAPARKQVAEDIRRFVTSKTVTPSP